MATQNETTAYGGFWIRFLALGVDTTILLLIAMVLGVAGGFAAGALGEIAGLVVGLLMFLVWFLYFPVMHASERQATYGKQLLGMKVTDYAGNRISFLRAFGRFLATWVSNAVLMLGYLMAAFTKKKQALHDLLASTLVVRERKGNVLVAIIVMFLPFIGVAAAFMIFGAALLGMIGAAGLTAPGGQVKPVPQPRAQVVRPAQKPQPRAPAPKPESVAAMKPEPKPAAAAPEPKPEPKPVTAVREPKPEAKPVAAAPEPKPEPRPAAASATRPATPAPMVAKAEPPAPKPVAIASAAPAKETTPAAAKPAKRRLRKAQVVSIGHAPRYNDLNTAVWRGDEDGVRELLDMGRWVDKPGPDGMTPLMTAADLGHYSISWLLLERGADPNATGVGGQTALSIARSKKRETIEALLRRRGAR